MYFGPVSGVRRTAIPHFLYLYILACHIADVPTLWVLYMAYGSEDIKDSKAPRGLGTCFDVSSQDGESIWLLRSHPLQYHQTPLPSHGGSPAVLSLRQHAAGQHMLDMYASAHVVFLQRTEHVGDACRRTKYVSPCVLVMPSHTCWDGLGYY